MKFLGTAKRMLRRGLRSVGLRGHVYLALEWLSSSGRQRVRNDMRNLAHLKQALGTTLGAPEAAPERDPVFLIYGAHGVRGVVAKLPLLMAARRLGFRLCVLLPYENVLVVKAYRRCGAQDFIFLEDCMAEAPHPRTAEIRTAMTKTDDLKDFIYKGCRVGKFSLSTVMRWSRLGDPDIADLATDRVLRAQLDQSFRAADAAEEIVAALRPTITLLNERGYSPFGEVFDTVLKHGGTCITWNAGHRNNMLILKRYRRGNVETNPFSLSDTSWDRMKRMPWSESCWHRVRDEIVDSYKSGEWFSECATQLDKIGLDRAALVERLGLDPARKTACVFPHMFWDATFFWGVDLFDNYERWFTEVLKVARDNTQLNWVIKIHPANVAKAIRDGYHGEHSEILTIRRTLGELPYHVKLIPPESDIATLSLFDVMDFCLTVRGTIGIEASCLGIPVLTAGTGRYDGRGFTRDFSSPDAYLEALRRLPDIAPMTLAEIELARRFAYGTFIARPTPLHSISLAFHRDPAAMMEPTVLIDRASLLEASDVRSIAEWIAGGEDDYLVPDAIAGGSTDLHIHAPVAAAGVLANVRAGQRTPS